MPDMPGSALLAAIRNEYPEIQPDIVVGRAMEGLQQVANIVRATKDFAYPTTRERRMADAAALGRAGHGCEATGAPLSASDAAQFHGD